MYTDQSNSTKFVLTKRHETLSDTEIKQLTSNLNDNYYYNNNHIINGDCKYANNRQTKSSAANESTNSCTTINSRVLDVHYYSIQKTNQIYQPNVRTSKIFRVLTVLAYIVAVSMAAILITIYYTFIWNPYANNNIDRIDNISDELLKDWQTSTSKTVSLNDIDKTILPLQDSFPLSTLATNDIQNDRKQLYLAKPLALLMNIRLNQSRSTNLP